MSKFEVLNGSAIGKAITSFGKAITSHKAREHQVAYSAIAHMEPKEEGKAPSNDPKYLNALYAATPANYRAGLKNWALAFARVRFDDKAENGPFVYNPKGTADLVGAMDVAPADYAKATSDKAAAPLNLVKAIEGLIKKAIEANVSARELNALKLCLSGLQNGEMKSAPVPVSVKVKAVKPVAGSGKIVARAPKVQPVAEIAAAA